MKSNRNKTIDISLEDGQEYLARCISIENPVAEISKVINKTIQGNMLSVCPMLPPNSFDLIIADPPYNLTKAFNGTNFVKMKNSDYENYTRQWLSLIHPLLKDTGSIYVCCDWETGLIVGQVLGEFFKVRNRITWQREKGRGAKSNWKNGLEDIYFATKSEVYTFNLDAVKIRKKVIAPYYEKNGKPRGWEQTEEGNFRFTCPSNFWDDITIPFWAMTENTAHPTQKPEKLIAKLILASSNPSDTVFDPFLGSGTTSVVAQKLNRNYLGIEQNPQYCIWAEKRIEMAQGDPTIQGFIDGVFWDRRSESTTSF